MSDPMGALFVIFIVITASTEAVEVTCPHGDTPLSGVFCGRGPTRQDCPDDYFCNIDPVDRFAVCCKEVPDMSMCPGGDKPLPRIFCGRGPTRQDCPAGYVCNIEPTDRFAVCCKEVKDICKLKPDTGPCEAYMPMWFYNDETKRCEKFIYGGCFGNDNRFSTKAACDKRCQDTCFQPAEPGNCRAYIDRWYYNAESGECEVFKYGGCDGNSNNFHTKAACERKCADVCALPAEMGPCEAAIDRWFFNQKTRRCEMFIYGGCEGNANNFLTAGKCKARCVKDLCSLPADPGPCDNDIPRWFYNTASQMCERFSYGDCEGNRNNFHTKAQCQIRCDPNVCSLPSDSGPCYANVPSWYYNSGAKECQQFQYGGCKGNGNRFTTEEACQHKCVDKCHLPPKTLPCKAKFTRWYYNPKSRQCETFTYGGCQPNANNFLSEQDCEFSCEPCPTDCPGTHCPAGLVMKGRCPDEKCKCHCPCLVPKKCKSCKKPKLKRKCKKSETCVLREVFCKGLYPCPYAADCKKLPKCPFGDVPLDGVFCGRGPKRQDCPKGYSCNIHEGDRYAVCCIKSECYLPPDSGCGDKKKRRWYYDQKHGCKKFVFSGKGGNKNNFRSKKACKEACT